MKEQLIYIEMESSDSKTTLRLSKGAQALERMEKQTNSKDTYVL